MISLHAYVLQKRNIEEWASQFNDEQRCKLINARDEAGFTPLALAAALGLLSHVRIVTRCEFNSFI